MQEIIRNERESGGSGPGGLGDIFARDAVGLVTVHHGLHTEQLPVANLTVGQIRSRFRDRLDIDPRSRAQIDGQDVSDDVVVRAGQMVMFVRQAGEKGDVGPGTAASLADATPRN